MIPALVEGFLDERVLKVLWRQLGRNPDDLLVRNAAGSPFWGLAQRYNQAGGHRLVLGLADLEQEPCASDVLRRRVPGRSAGFKLRLAVRMVESWLIADRDALALYLGVGVRVLPRDPDNEPHPKRRIVDIARRSRKRSIRDRLVPESTGALVGAEYTPAMAEFVDRYWDSSRARRVSPSLDRACLRWAED